MYTKKIVRILWLGKEQYLVSARNKIGGEKAKERDIVDYKFQHPGKLRSRNGVSITVDKNWKDDDVNVQKIRDSIIVLKFSPMMAWN